MTVTITNLASDPRTVQTTEGAITLGPNQSRLVSMSVADLEGLRNNPEFRVSDDRAKQADQGKPKTSGQPPHRAA